MTRSFHVLLAALLLALSACGGGSSSADSSPSPSPPGPPVSPGSTPPSVTSQPVNASVLVGQTANFVVAASGTGPLSYQWYRRGASISGATAASYTTSALSGADSGATFYVVVRNDQGSATSNTVTLTVSPKPGSSATGDVVTYKNDLARTGQYLYETVLTPANVSAATFGLLRVLPGDGEVFAQPLYLAALSVGGSVHNVAFVATEHNSVYAYDADSGAQLWQSSLTPTGETASDDRGCGQVSPQIGVTATPVIDRTAGAHGAMYLVAMTKDGSGGYHQRLHALDITTGAELFNGPAKIAASYPMSGGSTTFDPSEYKERAGLLLLNGEIYTTWASHCDNNSYTGWIIAYNQITLAQTRLLNVGPNSNGTGPAIWMAGGAPAVDASGNIFLLTANGAFETTLDANGFPSGKDYGNAFLRISAANGTLTVADYFALWNTVDLSTQDLDLGSSGVLLLPDLTDASGVVRHLAVGGGKDGNLYVVNREAMGKFNAASNQIWQELDGREPNQVRTTPAYFNGRVYYSQRYGPMQAFTVAAAQLSSSPSSQTANSFGYPGGVPAISANGTANAIVWAPDSTSAGVLHAYDATNLGTELYNSTQAANGRDSFGMANKFTAPTIAGGKVFVGTTSGVAVFGLLGP